MLEENKCILFQRDSQVTNLKNAINFSFFIKIMIGAIDDFNFELIYLFQF